MCKKDSDGAICCSCCKPWVQFTVMAVVGMAVMVASFVIAAVVLTMLQDGVNNTVRYNSPQTDQTAFNDWLTTIPQLRSTNDASYKYYAYYMWNLTNLDAVVAAGLNPLAAAVVPNVDEVGPYVYRKYVNRFPFGPNFFDANQDVLTFQEWGWYVFQPDLSVLNGRTLDDANDVIYQPSAVYTGIFGNPLLKGSNAFGLPEFAFRGQTANVLPYIFGTLMNTTFFKGYGVPLFQNPGPFPATVYLNRHIWHSSLISFVTPSGTLTSIQQAMQAAGAQGVLNSNLVNSPIWEMYNFVPFAQAAGVLPNIGTSPFSFFTSEADAMLDFGAFHADFFYSTQNCSDIRPITQGSALCFLDGATYTNLTKYQTALLRPSTQIPGMRAFYSYIARYTWNWIFTSMGHQGTRYAPVFGAAWPCQNYSDMATLFSQPGCTAFNNGNMWIKRSPKSLLWEETDLVTLVLTASKTTNRPMHSGYFKNQTDMVQAAGDLQINAVGTGINHIGDVDNIYAWSGTAVLPTIGANAPWCHQPLDPVYAPTGRYYVQNFLKYGPGTTFQQVTQAQSTKYSPNYPPGRVSDSNKYKLENSVIGDQSFQIDIWVSDIVRHATMTYRQGITLNGISINRYAIDQKEYDVIPFFGQYHHGLANYSCPANGGPHLFACLPRFGTRSSIALAQLDAADLSANYGIDLATMTYPTDDAFNAAGAWAGELFFDASQLEPFLDVEPITGQTMSGALKMQLNLLVQPWLGAPKQTYDTLNALEAGAYFVSLGPKRNTLIPTVWLNKFGYLSTKQANSFKSLVYGAKTASFVVVIVGTIVGGILMIVGLACVAKIQRTGYGTQTSKSDLAL